MTYHSEKVVKEPLPDEALLLTREDVQRLLRISRSTFDAIKRSGDLKPHTIAFGRCFRYRRDFVEKVARGEIVLRSVPIPSRKGALTWREQALEAVSISRQRRAERRQATASAPSTGTTSSTSGKKAGGKGSNFRKSALTEVAPRGKKGGKA